MYLDGQADYIPRPVDSRARDGYAMVALLVAMSIMSVMLTVAMPVWHQMTQREKEAELIFRGQQYARAIGLFQRRAGPGALPPTLDVLIEQRFLRKKFKDPITGEDFQPLISGQPVPGSTAAPGATPPGGPAGGRAGGPATGTGRGAGPATAPSTPPTTGSSQGSASAFGPARAAGQTPGMPGGTGAVGGIQGVVSKSKAKSIRLYNGRNVYNEWTFMYVPPVQAPGAGGGDGTGRGGRGRGLEPAGQPTTGPGGFGGSGSRGRGTAPPGPPGAPGTGFPSGPPPGGAGAPPTGPPRR
jgi:type II secretory pathway pseudopilin PulG